MFQKSLLKQNLYSTMLLVIDSDYRVVWVNHSLLHFFCLDRNEIVGRHLECFNFFAPIVVTLKQFSSIGREFSYTSRYITELNERGLVWISYTFQGIPFGDTQVIIVTLTDESDFSSNLETTINAQRLYALGTLMKGFAHDFNNVFTGIISHLDLALTLSQSSSLPQEMLAYLSSAESMARRGASVVNKLQSLVGSQSFYPVPFDLGEFIKEIVIVMRHCLGRKIKVADFEKPNHMCLVSADQNRIFQVFVNLCLNARDAMPSGGTISFSLEEVNISPEEENQRDPGKYWKVTVADTGTGMPPEVAEKLFTPFFTTKSGRDAIGLGMYVSLKIVESLGGWMEVKSQVGEGSKISFYLPALVNTSQDGVRDDNSEFRKPFQSIEKSKGNQNILIVDDSESIRKILVMTLKHAGYSTVEVSSCTQLKQLLSTVKPDDYQLVLLDINLEDGEAGSLIREIKSKINSKIIIISGELPETLEGVADKNVVDGYLNKPFYPVDALQIIHACLNVTR